MQKIRLPILIFGCLLLFAPLLRAESAPLIRAEYIKATTDSIVIRLQIANPAPSPIIVTMLLSEHTQIITTKPAANKINDRKGKIKWLIKDMTGSSLDLEVNTSGARDRRDVVTKISYSDPTTGKMETLEIRP